MSSTEATLGSSGYHAVIHVAGLQQLLDSPPPDNTQLETTGEDFSALLNSILNMYGEVSARGLFRRWGATFGAIAVKRRPSAFLLKPMLSLLPLQRRVRTVLDALVNEANAARGERPKCSTTARCGSGCSQHHARPRLWKLLTMAAYCYIKL